MNKEFKKRGEWERCTIEQEKSFTDMNKVLILTTIGGFLPQFEMNDVAVLQKLGYEVHYASNFNNPVYDVDRAKLLAMGIKLHQIEIQKSPLHIFRNIKALRQIIGIMSAEQIGIYHFHNPMGGVLGRVAALFYGKPGYIIYTAHGFHFFQGAAWMNWILFYPVERLLARNTNCLITINKEDYNRAGRFRLRYPQRVVRIPGVGIDLGRFRQTEGMREQIRRELGIEDGTFYILSVGEVNANKNHEVILRAMAGLKDTRIHYGICGIGNRESFLGKLAAELGVDNQFTLFGYKNDIPRMLHCADCFAFPSKREGLGMAAIEAMAVGIPLITSDCRGTREYMKDGITGYVCYAGDEQEYGEAIRKMMDSPEKRVEMSAACRKRAKKFNIKRTNAIMTEIYREMYGITKP